MAGPQHLHPVNNLGKALLEAGRVTRFHTTPHIQPYNVATHSWGMAALLCALYPGGQPSLNLVWSVLFHDVAERWLGDIPSPAKWWITPDAQEGLDSAEQHLMTSLGLCFVLTEEEQHWLHALDLLELYQYCNSELSMGNTNTEQAMTACFERLLEPWVPKPITEWLMKGDWDGRTDDSFGRHTS